ncbi:MAG TPA: tannase/feruloyl esterase family alpha/beta hydrolase, partial [Vicinamibacterales bacterium]
MSTARLLAAGALASVAVTLVTLTITIAATTPATAAAAANGICESLASRAFSGVTITSAQTVAAGAFSIPGAARQNPAFKQLPEFCRVVATLAPSSDSHIEMELWLPAQNWNGKFLAVGNGGWAGNIVTDAIATGLSRGYAAASNDTGHQDAGAAFATRPEKVIDFGYRAMHEMTVR